MQHSFANRRSVEFVQTVCDHLRLPYDVRFKAIQLFDESVARLDDQGTGS